MAPENGAADGKEVWLAHREIILSPGWVPREKFSPDTK